MIVTVICEQIVCTENDTKIRTLHLSRLSDNRAVPIIVRGTASAVNKHNGPVV